MDKISKSRLGSSQSDLRALGTVNTKQTKLKTPSKTPLKLPSSCKKTTNSKTNDRYIPNRTDNGIELSYHLMSKENIENEQHKDNKKIDTAKRKLLCEISQINDKESKILNFNSKLNDSEQSFAENLKLLYSAGSSSNSVKRSTYRHVINAPEKILDAPDIKDDFCKLERIIFKKNQYLKFFF